MQSNDTAPAHNKTVIVSILVAAALLVGIGWAIASVLQYAEEFDSRPRTRGLTHQKMHRKSEALQQIMDALVRDDFGAVRTAVEAMKRIGIHANWYLKSHSGDRGDQFQNSTERLIESASNEDYKAAAEAYDDLATSCIACHRFRLDDRGADR